jgi:tetratricopeptide (TPR) repeat protein
VALSLLVAVGTLTRLTIGQIAIWRDSESLWTHELRYEPENMEAYNNRASHYYESGRYPEALADYNAALAVPAQVSAKHARKRRAACFNDRAITQIQLGSTLLAIADESEAIKLMPNQPGYYLNRARMYQQVQMTDAAQADWESAQRLIGNSPHSAQPR